MSSDPTKDASNITNVTTEIDKPKTDMTTENKVNDIKKDISDMNNKFILLKDHFDKENKKSHTENCMAFN